jgi:toxin HigB-1
MTNQADCRLSAATTAIRTLLLLPSGPNDMAAPPWRLHPLRGVLEGHWAVWVDENFRLTFRFEGKDVVQADYRDYH